MMSCINLMLSDCGINYLSGGVVQVVNHKLINNTVLFNMHWK